MASDSSSKPSRRQPTRRATRPATAADSHYSKLTRRTGDAGQARVTSSQRQPTAQRSREQVAQRTRQDEPLEPLRSASTYESLSRSAQQRVYGNRQPKRRRSGNAVAAVLGIAVVAAFVIAGVLFWTHRSVAVTVNGTGTKIRINSSLASVREETEIATKPGNYISVSGNVLEEDKGYVFSAKVDGEELTHEQVEEYRVRGGEDIEITDGGDRMEDYDVEYREVQPKLVFEGDWGAVSFVKQWGRVGKQEIRTGKESGETADGDWVEELQDCIIMTKNVSPRNGERLVALTFDDGPAATYTAAYLDILAKYGAKATFFNLSSNEVEYPELAQRVAGSGNQICSHTNQHLQLSTLGGEDFRSEVTSAHDTIAEIAGVDTSIIRPPYGDFSRNCWVESQGTISASILWNQDTLDWSVPGVDAIVSNALAGIEPGSVILMHDGGGPRDQDLEAIPQIIERLQSDGYKLVTLSELLASDPDVPAEIAAGDARMPEGAVWPTEIGEAPADAE